MLVYFYLSDVFRTKEFKEAARNLIQKDDKDTGHTFLDALENENGCIRKHSCRYYIIHINCFY
jgi:hypothetical protein